MCDVSCVVGGVSREICRDYTESSGAVGLDGHYWVVTQGNKSQLEACSSSLAGTRRVVAHMASAALSWGA